MIISEKIKLNSIFSSKLSGYKFHNKQFRHEKRFTDNFDTKMWTFSTNMTIFKYVDLKYAICQKKIKKIFAKVKRISNL